MKHGQPYPCRPRTHITVLISAKRLPKLTRVGGFKLLKDNRGLQGRGFVGKSSYDMLLYNAHIVK